jgi:hypothetical protein
VVQVGASQPRQGEEWPASRRWCTVGLMVELMIGVGSWMACRKWRECGDGEGEDVQLCQSSSWLSCGGLVTCTNLLDQRNELW